jgi:hypothetical protein
MADFTVTKAGFVFSVHTADQPYGSMSTPGLSMP